MPERAAAKVCVDKRRIKVEELVHDIDFGVRQFVVDWWDHGVSKVLGGLIHRGDRHGGMGGEELINN